PRCCGSLPQLRSRSLDGSTAGRDALVDRLRRIQPDHVDALERHVQLFRDDLHQCGLYTCAEVDLPLKTVTVPSAAIASHESSDVGSASIPGPTVVCPKTGAVKGKRLKLTISAPVPLRNCLRESDDVFMSWPLL